MPRSWHRSSPIDDVRGSATYRRDAVVTLLRRLLASFAPMKVDFTLNGRPVAWDGPPVTRLAAALRDDLGLTGTKVGCDAGDCGACTVLLDGRQVCACLVAMGQVAGRTVETVEGLGDGNGTLAALQTSFLAHGAAQCGICTPGMLMAAQELLAQDGAADARRGRGCAGRRAVPLHRLQQDRRCRPGCDGIAARRAAGRWCRRRAAGAGRRRRQVTGRETFGADGVPADALWIRVVRSPHARARFTLGDLEPLRRRLAAVLTAADVPFNGFGIYPDIKDQPVLADGEVRYRGEAVAGPGRRARRRAGDPRRRRADRLDAGAAGCRHRCRDGRRCAPGAGRQAAAISCWRAACRRGKVGEAFATCAAVAEGVFETAFVEHAYIEPEAGWAERVGDRIEIHVSTQTPYMDRDEVAIVMRLRPEAGAHRADGLRRRLRRQARSLGPAAGGGGGVEAPAGRSRLVYTRPESMAASTKRHPARIAAKFGCDAEGRLLACEVTANFDTGAYASWGPTVANRVPVHAMGPYRVPNVRTWGDAWFTNAPPSGAFRGFGVPQAAIAHEAMMDELADKLGIDRLEFRLRNALARRRHDGDRPDARPIRAGLAAVPGSAAAALAQGAGRDRGVQCSRRRRSGAASASAACGTASATPRCPTPRACGSACRRPAR